MLALLTAFVVISLTGCSDGRPGRVPVSGKVMIDGQPLTNGFVRFHTPGHRMAQGGLDSEGRFQLSCYAENDGCVPGVHRVEINGMESLGENAARWHAPKRYADRKSSGLSVEIDGPRNDVLLQLRWDGGKPFDETFTSRRARRGSEEEEDVDL